MLLALALAGRAALAGNGGFAPADAGTRRTRSGITRRLLVIFGFTGAIFVIVEGALIAFIVRYRGRGRAARGRGPADARSHAARADLDGGARSLILVAIARVRLLRAAGDQERRRGERTSRQARTITSRGSSSTGSSPIRTARSRSTRCASRSARSSSSTVTSRRRDPQLVDPRARRQDRRDPGARQPHVVRAPTSRHVTRANAPSSAASSTPRCSRPSVDRGRRYDAWLAEQRRRAPRRSASEEFAGRLRQVPRHRRPGRHRPERSPATRCSPTSKASTQIVRDGSGTMPPVGSDWSDAQIKALVAYLKQTRETEQWRSGPSSRRAASVDARTVRQLADHGRPQADRDPLHRHEPRLLRRRRDPRAAHARAARDAERALRHAGHLQRALHDARHDDGLPRRRADPRRLRQLPRAADDRRARHGVPAAERALVLAVPVRRDRAVLELLRQGRRRAARAGRATRRCPDAFSPGTASTSGSSSLHILTIASLVGAINSSSRSTTCARPA